MLRRRASPLVALGFGVLSSACSGAAAPTNEPMVVDLPAASAAPAPTPIAAAPPVTSTAKPSAERSNGPQRHITGEDLCHLSWHGELGASVLVISEPIAEDMFRPALAGLCSCASDATHGRLLFEFKVGLGTVTGSSPDNAPLDACLKATLAPGRFTPHPEVPASDVVPPAGSPATAGPTITYPLQIEN
jgi:hypothetical protein